MEQPRISNDGRWYEIEIRHEGLNKFEIVRAKSEYEVQQKAETKLAQWNEMWARKLASQQAASSREASKEEAAKRTAQAQQTVARLHELLSHTLAVDDRLDWDSLKDKTGFAKPVQTIAKPSPPPISQAPLPPIRSGPRYQPSLGLLDYLFAGRRREKEVAASRLFTMDYQVWQRDRDQREQKAREDQKAYASALRAWEGQVKVAEQQWTLQKKQFEAQQAQHNDLIDELQGQYVQAQPEALVKYCELVLSRSVYPDPLPSPTFKVDYQPDTKILVVEYDLPSPEHMPRLKEVRYVQSRDALDEVSLTETTVNNLYDDIVYQIVLRTIHELYEADTTSAVDMIVFNGWVRSTDQSTGREVNACIVSVQAKRDEFLGINLSNVDPKACFKSLKGIGSTKLHGLAAIPPILQLNKNDSRFVSPREVVDQIDEGVNLAAIDWEDFEHLVRELFEKEFSQGGGEVKITQASRDRGVDAVAFDPDPIRGGKIVIQAKRYTNVVDVSAVRDLYGTVVNEGATKGILVTTSNYGPEAYEFAKGKPLTLLTGNNLLALLDKHGHKARIDLKEAKRILGEA